MQPSNVIETTVAEVTAELLRRGVAPDEAVSIIIEPVEGLALARRTSRVRVVAAGLTDPDIDRLIKQAPEEVEPNPAEARRSGGALRRSAGSISNQRSASVRSVIVVSGRFLGRDRCTSHRRNPPTPLGCYGRSPASNCWASNIKPVTGPLPLGRSNTNTRS